MEDLKKIENLLDHARDYINIRVDEAKLSVAEKTSGVIAMVIATTVVNIIFLLALIFAGAAGAVAIGQWLNNYWLGLLMVAGLYLLAGLIVWAAKERLIRIPVMNAIIRQLFKNDNDEKD
ncbi:phage holin family protein [Flavitalea sp. BT771]|uniref:phage holin family protein n=1 Tax=Flavitalea sp. BT771 TaxID=3063329 RepID=UPI0026E3C56D|nr:phage holin family protein [Flavitalea sp. BT771]MDO6429485.1 phage holin family protein [Flavitalea sp. BT771]MDV6218387.1 phage holin family protein [Flavitalea sp. BT771]